MFSQVSVICQTTKGEVFDLYHIIASLLRFGGMPVEEAKELISETSDACNLRLIFDLDVGAMLIHT